MRALSVKNLAALSQILTVFAAVGCAGSSNTGAALGGTSESDGIEVRLEHGSVEEEQTKRQLEVLLRRYDLRAWQFSSTIIVDQESIPHSHPVLTLHTRHLRDDLLLLSTYIHEQSHWYFEMNHAATSSAVKDLKTLFPDLPVGFPEGAQNIESSYEHLLVIMFEWQGLRDTIGELAALQVMQFWATDHYRALYRTVLSEAQKIRKVLAEHNLERPRGGAGV